MTDERVIDLSIAVPGTLEEIWSAIATGPGISSWFVPAKVEEGDGGEVEMDFSRYGIGRSTITVWDPPTRFVHLTKGPRRSLVYDWQIEPSEDMSIVRIVNAGFGSGERAHAAYEALSHGWPVFLENLRLHLTHFTGMTARPITPMVVVPGDHDEAWSTLCGALGVPCDLPAGAHVATSGDGVPVLNGTVEETVMVPDRLSAYVMLMDAPASGTALLAAEGGGEEVACSVWLYLYDEDAEELEDLWTPFISGVWPREPST